MKTNSVVTKRHGRRVYCMEKCNIAKKSYCDTCKYATKVEYLRIENGKLHKHLMTTCSLYPVTHKHMPRIEDNGTVVACEMWIEKEEENKEE
jgi:hypothetical protein